MTNISLSLLKNHFVPAGVFRSRTLATAIVVAMGTVPTAGFALTVTQNGTPGSLYGGAGGNATANATSSDLSNTAIATAGAGGDGYPSNDEGGKGGDASASAVSQSSSGNANVLATSQAFGGNAGVSYQWAGNKGGNATAHASSLASGSGSAEVNVYAQGGHAGTAVASSKNDWLAYGGTATATFAVDSASGPVKATVAARGGNGGSTTGSGRAGSGGSATLNNTLAISTTGSVDISQTAYGGNAGAVQSGFTGLAGAGSSKLNITANNANSLVIEARGYGGAGANRNDAVKPAENGGSGGATATGTSASAALVSVTTYAKGGAKGIGSGGAADGNNGSASANSIAVAGTGSAIAKASSESGHFYRASSQAQATGALSSIAEASSITEPYYHPRAVLGARAASDIGGETLAMTGNGLQMYPFFTALNEARAIVDPEYGTAHTMFVNAPSAGENFDVDQPTSVMGLVRLGAGVQTATTDSSVHLFSSSVTFSLDMSQVAAPQHLLFGLLEGSATGSGFQTLRFRIDQEGSTVIDQTFVSLSAAEAYFNDKTLDLGEWWRTISSDNILDLAIYLDVAQSGSTAGGYTSTLMFGNSVLGSGPSNPFPSVPLPGSFWLFGSALAGLLARRKLRG